MADNTPESETAEFDVRDIVIPALLRWARGTYSRSIAIHLSRAGYDDVPRNGAFVLGGMGNRGFSAGEMIRGLGVSKQAASQLIDTLVVRGYLEREVNAEDRRRMNIELTDRGRGAAAAIAAGIALVDRRLAEQVDDDDIMGMRRSLHALAEIRDELAEIS